MTDAVHFEQPVVAEGVLRVDVKESRAELMDVRHGINELAHQVAGVPLDADVLAVHSVEESLPQRRLAEQVVVHDRQVILSLRAMLERDAHAVVRGVLRDGLPESSDAWQMI